VSKFERLGSLIRDRRISKGMTQAELSAEFGYSSPQFISNWERGDCGPPLNILPKLAKILAITQKEIVQIILDETKREIESNFHPSTKVAANAKAKRTARR
jgi:transcriptional regulator with XRE-family HTH domain